MLSTVWPGDTLVVEHAASSRPVCGDIVLVLREGRLLAHRLIGKAADDASLVGKVTRVVRNGKSIVPRRDLRVSERAIAAIVRRSDLAARVVAGVRGFLQPPRLES